jgi:hypothetical protein
MGHHLTNRVKRTSFEAIASAVLGALAHALFVLIGQDVLVATEARLLLAIAEEVEHVARGRLICRRFSVGPFMVILHSLSQGGCIGKFM